MERPHANTYWVEPGRILAGEYPGAHTPDAAVEKVGRLLDAGIDTFIDLTEPHELSPYEQVLRTEAQRRGLDVRYHRFPIRDVSVPSQPSEMAAILDTVRDAVAAGNRVYIHCWGGVGRTGTVVGCHLVRSGLSGEVALQRLSELFSVMEKAVLRESPETPEQREWVLAWEETERASS